MIQAAHGFQDEIRAFIERGLWSDGRRLGPASFMGWATEQDGLIAGIALHDWHAERGTVEISAYASRHDWVTRARMAEVADYVFDQLGCRLVVARHSVRNRVARRIWKAMGATEVILPRMRGDHEDEAVAVLHRDEWLKSGFVR